MPVVPMRNMSILGMMHDKQSLLNRLMEIGVVEIRETEPGEEHENLYGKISHKNGRMQLDRNLQSLGDAIATLAPLDQRKKPMFQVMRDISHRDYMHIVLKRHEVLRTAEMVNRLKGDLGQQMNQINQFRSTILFLEPWKSLPIPVETTGTKACSVYFGTLPIAAGLSEVEQECGNALVEIHVVHTDGEQYFLAVYIHKQDGKAIIHSLKKRGFTPVSFGDQEGIPGEMIREAEKSVQVLQRDMESTRKALTELLGHLHELETVFDYYSIRKKQLLADEEIPQSKRVFLLDGWIPADMSEQVAAELETSFTATVYLREPKPDETIPVLLRNGPLGDAVQDVTRMYSLPSPREADPNRITAPFFILFFGLMLSDAGYGLIMAVLCGLLLWKTPLKEGMRRFFRLMMYCGLATVFWGALFGSWFGNVIPVLAGNPEMQIALWFDPVQNPERMLMWALLFGVIHLYVGIGVQGYNFIRDKKYWDAICDCLFRYIFYTGAVFLVLPFVPSINIEMAQSLAPAGTVLFVAGAVLLILTQGRSKKGIFGKAFGGIASMYGLVSFMSDILSYSRLLAMGLATSVIATIINNMGSAGGFNLLGIFLFILVFFIGHIFNFALNALGAYVHSSRLQYIEFFNKFFQGGGKAFQPLFRDTKYVRIKEQ